MNTYRKKPIIVEAFQWKGDEENGTPGWFHAARTHWRNYGSVRGGIAREGSALRVYTLEGVMRAEHGDWIIRGVKGEIYPCKPDVFAATYEAVPS